jgi:hypothetical protein
MKTSHLWFLTASCSSDGRSQDPELPIEALPSCQLNPMVTGNLPPGKVLGARLMLKKKNAD